jgi:uncharacterized lipoprotein YmbA
LKSFRLFAIAILGSTAAILAGCFGVLAPRPERTKFYVLAATEPASPAASPQASKLSIGLGPINFPQYLARSEMVTRTSSNRIELSSPDRWAEPLDVTFNRVLSLDLSRSLDGAQVMVFPWFGGDLKFDYRVQVTVDRFETNENGVARLSARWVVLDGNSSSIRYATSSDIRESSTAGNQASAAAALSRAAASFANQIAQAIVHLNSRTAQ